MMHQPIRFHTVLDEALRVASGEGEKNKETEREETREAAWSGATEASLKSEYLRGGSLSQAGLSIVISSEATAC